MHKTVLLNEAIDNLNVKEDGIYVDATLGFGGHSGLILKRVKRGFLFAFDQDEMAIEYSDKKLSEIGNNYEIIKSNFVNLKEELNNYFNKISKELNTDIDCFSNKALSHFNTKNEWENYNWKEKFPTANFHLNVKANVVSGQMITKT